MPKFYYKAQLIKQYKYYAFHKPYGVLSQFSEEREGDLTIGKYFNFPPDVYPCGRLDKDSEGLLLLTNDLIFKQKIMEPKNHVCKQYLCQLEGIICRYLQLSKDNSRSTATCTIPQNHSGFMAHDHH